MNKKNRARWTIFVSRNLTLSPESRCIVVKFEPEKKLAKLSLTHSKYLGRSRINFCWNLPHCVYILVAHKYLERFQIIFMNAVSLLLFSCIFCQ